MARNSLQEVANEKCELEMTPMIDVTFLLLIFFMCTLKFKILEGKLGAYLPKDVGVQATDAPPVEKVDIRLDVLRPGNKVRYDYKSKSNVPYTEAHAQAAPAPRTTVSGAGTGVAGDEQLLQGEVCLRRRRATAALRPQRRIRAACSGGGGSSGRRLPRSRSSRGGGSRPRSRSRSRRRFCTAPCGASVHVAVE